MPSGVESENSFISASTPKAWPRSDRIFETRP